MHTARTTSTKKTAADTHTHQGLKTPFCVPTDDLLRAKDDLLSEGGQSLSSLTEQASDKALTRHAARTPAADAVMVSLIAT